MPRVSVIIPTHNRKTLVQETIDSVLSQTFTDFEIIVVDDGSTDGTNEALQARYGGLIQYIWQKNQGESAARNYGVSLAKGEYIAFLDSDDLWLPHNLETQVQNLDNNPDAALSFAQYYTINAESKYTGSTTNVYTVTRTDLTLEALCLHNCIHSPSLTLICRHSIDGAGGFDPEIRYGEDWDLWLKLRANGQFEFIEQPLALIRQHRGSQYHNPPPDKIDERLHSHLKIIKRVFDNHWPGEIPPSLYEQAIARIYTHIALLDYLAGRAELAQQRLNEALYYNPTLNSFLGQNFLEWYKSAIIKQTVVEPGSIQTTLENFEAALRYWPEEACLSEATKLKFRADVYAGIMFTSYQVGNIKNTRYCLPRAIKLNPLWLLNKGVWIIGLKALLDTSA